MTSQAERSSNWVWLLTLFTAAGFIETMFYGQVNAFMPLYLPRLGVSALDVAAYTGIIVATSNATGIPFLPFWGTLADRYSRQPLIVRSFVAHIVAAGVMLTAGNVWVFLIGRSLMSLALGNTGLMMTTLSEHAPSTRVGFAFAVMNGAPPLGAFIGPLLGGRIVDQWGYPALLWINIGLMLLLIASLTFGYRDTFKGANRGPLLQMAADSVRLIFRSPRLRALFPALFVLFAGWMLAITYAPIAILSLYRGGQPGTIVGLVLGAGGLVTLVVSPIVGALADRFGHWRTLFAVAALSMVLWPLPAFAHGLVAFGVVWALLNGVLSGMFAVSFSVLSESAPGDVRGRVMSFAYLPVNVALIVGPGLGSLVTKGSVLAVFPTGAAFTALGIAMLALASRKSTALGE